MTERRTQSEYANQFLLPGLQGSNKTHQNFPGSNSVPDVEVCPRIMKVVSYFSVLSASTSETVEVALECKPSPQKPTLRSNEMND
jgi:hypothetical protein